MRKIVLALVSILGMSVCVEAQTSRQLNLTTGSKIGPAAAPWIQEIGTGIDNHQIVWTISGTVSTCSVKVQQSVDGVSWSDLIAGATCTSNGESALTAGIANYVRVNATTLTGSGTLYVRYLGFAPGLPATATIAGDVNVVQADPADLNATVVGGKSNNAAAPGATNIGALSCIANAAAPSYTEGRQVGLSCTLAGGLRLDASLLVTDPCNGLAKTVVPFSIATNTTTELYDGSASNYMYVCAFNIVVGGANNVALVEDATDSCASPEFGMAGGVTAATGWNFAANGGLTLGNGNGTVMKTVGLAKRVCLMTSSSAQTSGTISFVAAP